MHVNLRKEARKDISAGANFYHHQDQSAGAYFIESIQADIDDLSWQAGIHAQLFGHHCKRAKKFPFGIYYFVENDVAEVVAVLDLRGDPSATERRLEQRKGGQ